MNIFQEKLARFQLPDQGPIPVSWDHSIYAITKLLQRNTAIDTVNSMVCYYYLVQLAKQVDARSALTAFVHFASSSRPRTRKERASDVYSNLVKVSGSEVVLIWYTTRHIM